MISRIVKCNLLILAAALLTHTGCGKRAESDEPEPVMNDPAGDFAKLQGAWSRVPTYEGSPDTFVIFEGNLMTYDYPHFRATGQKGDIERFRFVLDSTRQPKRLTIIQEESKGEWIEVPVRTGGYGKRYKLEGDTLTLWTSWSEIGEQSYYVYKRVLKA